MAPIKQAEAAGIVDRPADSGIIRLLGSTPGRMAAAVLGAAALWPAYGPLAMIVVPAILVASFRSEQRAEAFSVLAVAMFLGQVWPQAVGSGTNWRPLLFSALWTMAVLLWSRKPFAKRHAVTVLHAGVILLIGGLAAMNLTRIRTIGSALAIQILAVQLLWRTSYWLRWRLRAGQGAPLWRHLYSLIPFIGAGGVPIGKSPEYFSRYEARDARALAQIQWQGLRLLALATLWRAILLGFHYGIWPENAANGPAWLVSVQSSLPSMDALLVSPGAFELWQRWLGLYVELFRAILELAMFGHTIVGLVHLLGYGIPRNTQRPLAASTILDFWNRYYFYFKELLVDFFFFPAYLRLKGMAATWRTMAAVFAAAFAGNLYYHTLLYSSVLMGGQGSAFVEWMATRAVYCALLAAGLSWSMIRRQRRTSPLSRRGQVAGMAGAATFYALIHIWNAGDWSATIGDRLRLVLSLAGVG